MIKSLYVLSRQGHPLYHYDFENQGKDIRDATLFSGLMSAIIGFLKEIDVGLIRSFHTETNKIYVNPVDELAYVLVVDRNTTYSDESIELLMKEFQDQLVIEYNQSVQVTMTKSENQLLDRVTQFIIKDWLETNKESKAAKKLREELW